MFKLMVISVWGLLSFLLVQVFIFLPIYLLGLILLPALLQWAPIVQMESRLNAGQMVEMFKWTWANTLFGNLEDGLSPAWWTTQCGKTEPSWSTRFTWFLRNPVNNMRFWPVISTKPQPEKVKHVGSSTILPAGVPCGFICWQGPYVGFRWQNTKRGIWLGWACNPSDVKGIPNDWRAYGFSVVLQVMKF